MSFFNPKKFVGMKLEDAKKDANDCGFTIRVLKQDGQSFAGTCEVNRFRINVEVDNGVITAVRNVG